MQRCNIVWLPTKNTYIHENWWNDFLPKKLFVHKIKLPRVIIQNYDDYCKNTNHIDLKLTRLTLCQVLKLVNDIQIDPCHYMELPTPNHIFIDTIKNYIKKKHGGGPTKDGGVQPGSAGPIRTKREQGRAGHVLSSTIGSTFLGYVVYLQARSCNEM